jgi:hypothetical protein
MTGLTKLPRNTPPTLHTIKHAYIESQVDVQIQLYISLQFLRTLYNKGHPETHKKTNVNYLTLNPEFNEVRIKHLYMTNRCIHPCSHFTALKLIIIKLVSLQTLQFPLDGRKIAEINLRLAIVHKSRTKKRYTQIGE